MKYFLTIFTLTALFACKSSQKTSVASEKKSAAVVASRLQEIKVDAERLPAKKVDFSVLSWSAKSDTLEVVVRYSGGCGTHSFEAYFSGGWQKSFPPKAVLELEHLNPSNDQCRSVLKDTLLFDMHPLRYEGGKTSEVVVKWQGDAELYTNYRYGN